MTDPRGLALAEAEETLRAHRDDDGRCGVCGEAWPCHPAIVAGRVRDALVKRSARRP